MVKRNICFLNKRDKTKNWMDAQILTEILHINDTFKHKPFFIW